jgi:hypothetical protein
MTSIEVDKVVKQASATIRAAESVMKGYQGAGRLSASIAVAMADEASAKALAGIDGAIERLGEAKDHLSTARRLKKEGR